MGLVNLRTPDIYYFFNVRVQLTAGYTAETGMIKVTKQAIYL